MRLDEGETHFEIRMFRLHVLQALLGGKDAEKFDLAHFGGPSASRSSAQQGRTPSPGIPQSIIMANAAHAVPPVAISGSNTNTISTGGVCGSLE